MNEIEVKILKELAKGISLTRDKLAFNLEILRSILFDSLSKLREKEYVFSYKKYTHSRGRPKIYYYIPVRILNLIREKNFFNLDE